VHSAEKEQGAGERSGGQSTSERAPGSGGEDLVERRIIGLHVRVSRKELK